VAHDISGELAVGASASIVPSRCVEVSAELSVTAVVSSAPHRALRAADLPALPPLRSSHPVRCPQAAHALLAADLSRTRRFPIRCALRDPGLVVASTGVLCVHGRW
jgi:hypothetical protein